MATSIEKLREKGPVGSLAAILRRAAGFAAYLLLRAARVRFLFISHPDRIGHLAAEPDCYIKEGLLRRRARYWGILVCPSDQKVANACLMDYWRQKFTVMSSPFLCRILTGVSRRLQYDIARYFVAIDETAIGVSLQSEWGNREPLLRLSDEHKAKGRAALAQLGLPPDAWFVCVHSREGGYSPGDESLHSYRNSDINSYSEAIRAVTDRGGWCIRVGDPTMQPLTPMDRVVDYVHHPMRSDWMDIFLCASCRFFIGNTSGLFLVSTVFGVPCVLVNMTPLSAALPPGANDIAIPKTLFDRRNERPLPFAEAFSSPASNYRFTDLYRDSGLEVRDNSPDEIRDVVVEMFDRLEGRLRYGEEDEILQRRIKSMIMPGHNSYGSVARVGRDFLRKYAQLLGDARK